MNERRIRTIAVVGDGVAGWSVAAALKKRVAGVAVALVPVAGLSPGLVDLFGQAAPSIGDFHRDIGLDERDVVVRTGAAFRLGTRFIGWGRGDYIHAYGPAGAPIGGASFASLWSRDGDRPFDGFAPAAMLGAAGRFTPAGTGIAGSYAHGLQLDPAVYPRFLEAYARHLGVAVPTASLAGVERSGERIEALVLDDGSRLIADLHVDATNAEARLAGPDRRDWEDWSAWLPCDRLTRGSRPADQSLSPLDRVEAMEAGWRLAAFLPMRTETATVFASAAHEEPGEATAFRSGRRGRAWSGNVVAIGEAHCVVEPLEAAPLHLLHTQIDRLIASLPDRDFAEAELAHYNRETNEEADRLRDFLILHYAVARRTEPFWQAVRDAPLPPLLAETLALFRERGRLPIRDGESFDRDSWQAVLLGSGIRPRRIDVLASGVDTVQARGAMAAFSARLAQAVAAAPTHRDYLAALRKAS